MACMLARLGFGRGMEIDMKTSKVVWIAGLSLFLACDGGDDGDGGGDTSAMTLGMTLGGTAGDDDGSAGDDGNDTAGDDDAADDGMATTMSADDGVDDGMDDGAACNPPCAAGQECIAGQCFGGDDSTGEPAMCATPVMLADPTCDECVKGACCDAMQACFGDETTMMATPCFDLNQCIATNCTAATDLNMLQMCVDANCAETSDQLQTWLMFNNCAGMNCQAACAG